MTSEQIIQALKESARQKHGEVVRIRRLLHRYPETAWTEFHTAYVIAKVLKDCGADELILGRDACDEKERLGVPEDALLEKCYERARKQCADQELLSGFQGGFTGMIGVFHLGPGPVVALRFDMDALPVEENQTEEHLPFREGFVSCNKGVMHACGHDGHVAMGLGVAMVLKDLRKHFKGTVKLIFQPAEEGARGARSIVAKGHLSGVDYLLGMHMSGNSYEAARMILESNKTLATTKFDVVIQGRAAHGAAAPQDGNNALLAACTAVQGLYAISRTGEGDTRINVGLMKAGEGRNVIAAHAYLQAEVRGTTGEANDYMFRRAGEILEAAAQMHGCTVQIKVVGNAGYVPNSPQLAERIAGICREKLGVPAVYLPERVWNASEDFSIMAAEVINSGGQVCYIKNTTGTVGELHEAIFDYEENALYEGVVTLGGVILELCSAE